MAKKAPKQAAKYSILIVEDEPRLVNALQKKFSQHGYDVAVGHDGVEGLQKMNEEKYDFILQDLLMPKKDGFQVLAEKGKTLNADTPVCVLTVIGQEQNLQRARDLGAWKCFVKSDTSLTFILDVITKELDLRKANL